MNASEAIAAIAAQMATTAPEGFDADGAAAEFFADSVEVAAEFADDGRDAFEYLSATLSSMRIAKAGEVARAAIREA